MEGSAMVMDDIVGAFQPEFSKSNSVLDDEELLLTVERRTLNDDSMLKKVTPTEKDDSVEPTRKRRSPRTRWKKPKDMPRRPLSAYNLFFQRERVRLLQSLGKKSVPITNLSANRESPIPEQVSCSDSSCDNQDKTKGERKARPRPKTSGIGFAYLAKTAASKWKQLNPTARSEFEAIAAMEKERYKKEVVIWRRKKKLEEKMSAQAQTIDAVLRLRTTLAGLAFMRSLSNTFQIMSHHQAYQHQPHNQFSGFQFATPRLLRTYEERSLDPIAITNVGPIENTTQDLGSSFFSRRSE